MADNVAITPGSGASISTAEVTTLNGATVAAVEMQRVKVAYGTGATAREVDLGFPLPVFNPDVVGSGTITATDAVVPAPGGAGALLSGASTAGSYVALACPGSDSAWNIEITGLTSGTLYFEESLSSTNGTDGQWVAVNGRQTGVVNTVLTNNSTTNGVFRGNTSGAKWIRVRSVGALTGTPAIIIRLSNGTGAIFLNASIPAGGNLLGKVGIDQTTPGTTNRVDAHDSGITGTANLTALNTGLIVALDGRGAVTFGISGTWTGTISFQASNDGGVTYPTTINAQRAGDNTITQTVTSTAGNDIYRIAAGGFTHVRAFMTAFTSGTASVQSVASSVPSAVVLAGAVTLGPLTKGTQNATGVATQDLKDSGRTHWSATTVITGVTAVTTEALVSLVPTRAGVSSAAVTSQTVTAGKRLRVTSMTVGFVSTAAAVLSMRFGLRTNPAGAVAATSPLIFICPLSSGAALAQAGNQYNVPLPDGLEFAGNDQFGVTQIGSAATGTCWVTLNGFEY